jgi:hypothetical protein
VQADPKTQIVESLIELLEGQSSREKLQKCDHCGRAMQFVDTDYWLFGTEMKWKMSVPFCRSCDADLLARFESSDTARAKFVN